MTTKVLLMAVGGLLVLGLSMLTMPVLLGLFPGAFGFLLCIVLAALAVAAGISIVSLCYDFVDHRERKKAQRLHGRRRAGKM